MNSYYSKLKTKRNFIYFIVTLNMISENVLLILLHKLSHNNAGTPKFCFTIKVCQVDFYIIVKLKWITL